MKFKINTYRDAPRLIQEVYDLVLSIPDQTDVCGSDLAGVLTEDSWVLSSDANDWMMHLPEQCNNVLDLFDVIHFVVTYEKLNFGDVYTELKSPASITESFLRYVVTCIVDSNTSSTLDKKWNDTLSDKEMKMVLKEVVTWINSNPRWWHRAELERLV